MNSKLEKVFAGGRTASLTAALAALLLPGVGLSQNVTLTDGGSSATLDLGSSAGMNSWSVLNQNQLNQQWFWYNTGSGVSAPINSIGGLTYVPTGNNQVVATYQNSQLSVSVTYVLNGGGVGSGSADMTESIAVANKSASAPLTVNFFEYSSFNLLQSHNNTVQVFGSPGSYYYVQQNSGPTAIQEGIVSPYANYAEAAPLGQTLNELNTTPNLNLNDNPNAGPGDVTWAFQWFASINPSSELDIFKDKSISITTTPEPSAMAMVALGLGALGVIRRRKSS